MTPPITRDGDGIFVDDDGVKRRTILAGAAWSIPVISVATAAPAFAATTDLKLAFDKSSYSGEGCKTITGVKVTATRNGVAAAGESVTVTLADGYTFSDGSTSYTATTGSDGSISLPDIKVPGKGGDSTFSATSGSASTTASVSGTAATGNAYQFDSQANTITKLTDIPADTTAIGWQTFLASDKTLYYSGGKNGAKIATDVSSAYTDIYQNDAHVFYVSGGTAYEYVSSTGKSTAIGGIPSNTKAVGWNTFLGSDKALYYSGVDGPIAKNVTSATTKILGGTAHVFYVSDGKAYDYDTSKKTSTELTSIPKDTTSVGWNTFLGSDKNLYYNGGTTDTKIASDVSSAYTDIANDVAVVYYVSNGVAYKYNSSTKATTELKDIPKNTKVVGWNTFLGTDGKLYYSGRTKNGAAAPQVSDGVTSAAVTINSDPNAGVYFVSKTCSALS